MISLHKKHAGYKEYVELASRSSLSTTDPDTEGCGFSLDTTCYVETQAPDVLTSGDIVYNDAEATSLFDGGGLYWRIKLPTQASSRLCLVSSEGVISIYSICV
jgi:hypothetical protein